MTRWRFVVLSYIPGTKSHRLTKELRQAVKVYELRLFDREQGKSCKDCLNEIDTVLMEIALLARSGNKTSTADDLNISRAPLLRKIGKTKAHDSALV